MPEPVIFVSSMRKILVDLHRLGGNKFNGLYHFSYQLGKHLVSSPPDDMKLYFYLPKSQFGIFGEKVFYVPQRSRDKYYRFGTKKFDIWHITTAISWYRPFNKKTKNIFTIHDLNFLNEEEYKASSKKNYLQLIQQRVNRADYLTFISNFAYEQAQQYLKLGKKPFSVIYNGCNIPNIQDINEPAYLPKKPFLFSIGQLHSRKNFHVLPPLLTGNDDELIIAGINDTLYAKKVMDEARRYNVEKRVKLIGTVTENEKHWYYKNCKVFVFPSIGEGFGLPVVEAMYFGKPVFLSKYTSLPEVGGNAAYYFNDFSPESMQHDFEKGMNDFKNNNRMTAIKQQAASFDWNKTAKEYLEIYRNLSSI